MASLRIVIDITGDGAGVAWQTPTTQKWLPLEGKRPSTSLLPALAECMSHGDLRRLGVVVGPGSFTGIRTGIATALGLKMAKDISVVGFSKFEVMAHVHARQEGGAVRFLIPARADRLFACTWSPTSGLGEPEETLVANLKSGEAYLASGEIPGKTVPRLAQPLAELALDALEMGLGQETLEPLYIRPADTRKNLTFIEKLLKNKH